MKNKQYDSIYIDYCIKDLKDWTKTIQDNFGKEQDANIQCIIEVLIAYRKGV